MQIVITDQTLGIIKTLAGRWPRLDNDSDNGRVAIDLIMDQSPKAFAASLYFSSSNTYVFETL